ncbi:YbaN family protein [Lentibacter algarum]|uniref:YbaN family protein n=1 Tax=Lentibacter algarum TaxID=576131 RepID=UPI001C075DEE|nr:YbaN family protein [Lentibacter algarum]MBU2980324.1 YbaN family protein [Lentibacter algarum]
MRVIWLIAGLLSLGVGFIGIVLPLVPTVPLVLLAAYCFARSSEKLHQWLVSHPTFGSSISDWHTHGAISKTGKRLATVSVLVVLGISLIANLAIHILLIQAATLSIVLWFIWSRPTS